MSDFTKTTDGDITIITWDVANRPMNVMSEQGLRDFDAMITQAIADDAVKGIIITSGKPDFAAGMDLNVIAATKTRTPDNPAQGCFEMVMEIHHILRRIELAGMDPKTQKGGTPIVAVLPGTALGLGLEIPLACHHIIAANNPKAKIGLPEIKVGIFPGAGGTTRLARKLGAMAAAPFLLEGKLSSPDKALKAGLIDAVSDDPMQAAKDWIAQASDADLVKPWDARGYKMPGGAPYHPAGFMTFVGASAMVNGNTQGVYPAAKAILSAVYEGAQVPFDTALKIEARYFTSVLLHPSSANMIRSLFVNKGALEKGAVRPADVPDQRVSCVGVLGAGMMGAGIALVSAMAGIKVVLIDQSQDAADRGKDYTASYMDKGIKRGKTTDTQKQAALENITATTDLSALQDCDLIVEAVFEDPATKADITQKVEAIVGPDCIFGTNTSTIPITSLAQASVRPDQFIGIHFFSPVEKMPLVEIIKGEKTGDRAVAKALDYARQIKKTPIVVNDARFFFANRCIIPYINEGLRMAQEGVALPLIENAAKQLGMPVGPLQLLDETSIDLGAKIARATKAALGDEYDDAVDNTLFWMEGAGRLGRKSKAGMYEYDDVGKRTGLWAGFNDRHPVANQQPDLIDVQHRLMFVQALESVRALEENVLTDIREGDVGAIMGWGFAPWTGGPLSWLDMIGSAYAVERCDELATRHGARFTPPAMLRDMAQNGDGFYGG